MLRLIKMDDLRNKSIRQLVFEICPLREEQEGKFKKISQRLRERQRKIDFEKIRKRIMGLSDEGFEEIRIRKERKIEELKIEKLIFRNRAELFRDIKKELEEKQRRRREIKFRKIRNKLEKRGRYRELEAEISRRRKKLTGKSKCTFPVLYELVNKYKKAKKK